MSLRNLTFNVSTGLNCPNGCMLKIVGNAISLTPAKRYDDVFWTLNCAFLVVSMQLGFAMLEVGSVRKAHSMTVLAKNVLDSTVSMIGFWAFCELRMSDLVKGLDGEMQSHLVLFHSAFCGTAVTICSGSMAERAHMNAYLCFSILMSLLIYPQIAEGAWTQDALLSRQFHGKFSSGYSYYDFAGSGVVHLTGGCCALVGNFFLGRRIMKKHESGLSTPSSSVPSQDRNGADPRRLSQLLQGLEDGRNGNGLDHPAETQGESGPPDYKQHGKAMQAATVQWLRRYDNAERDKREFQSSSSYLQVMGMFTLWVGWYGFNAGSTLTMAGLGSRLASIVAMNTTLAACGGGLGAFVYCYYMKHFIDLGIVCNGVISGLISITAPCTIATRAASTIIGFISGLILYPFLKYMMRLFKLDDPIDAIPVHAGAGILGVMVVPFCRPNCDLFEEGFSGFESLATFCRDDYQLGPQLAAQAWGCLIIIMYTTAIAIVIWGVPAVSECVIAREDQYLQQVANILFKMALSAPPADEQPETDPMLVDALSKSELATKILKQYGWMGDHFEKPEYTEPTYLLQISRRIKSEQNEKVTTGLEVAHWRIVNLCVNVVWWCPLRKCCTCRLRILPSAELSGLGTTDIEGGWILARVRRLVASVDKHAASADKNNNKHLQKEVRQLHALAHGQEALLRQLTRQHISQLRDAENGSVSSRSSPLRPASRDRSIERSIERSVDRVRSGSSGDGSWKRSHRDRAQNLLHRYTYQTSGGKSSASTQSECSAGNLSQHSNNESTPPPTLFGNMQGSRTRDPLHDVETFNAVAQQLAEVLERQQLMLSRIQTSPTHSGGLSQAAPPRMIPEEPVAVVVGADTNDRTADGLPPPQPRPVDVPTASVQIQL